MRPKDVFGDPRGRVGWCGDTGAFWADRDAVVSAGVGEEFSFPGQ